MSELSTMGELIPPDRLLMGPGPSNVHWRVYRALATPIIGHLDPSFLSIMDEISSMLRAIFKTQNRLTIPISGTGSSGMEACFVNILEPGDKAIVCVNGLFGERMVDVASRCGARVIRIDEPWGKSFKPERVIESLKKNKDAKLLAIVHAETSTGVLQPLSAIGEFMKQGDTLFLVDCVTSLGGCDVRVDEWGIDLCYSATQKCLSIPPGLSPLTVSDKALERIKGRKSKTQSWYLDLGMIASYWGKERIYHHTAPISMLYALREGLRLVLEEGLDERYERHKVQGSYLQSSLIDLGFKLFAEEGSRLPMLTSVLLPDGVNDAETRKTLLTKYGIEIGAGLGATKGKIWRIGLMGETARKEYTERLLFALKGLLG